MTKQENIKVGAYTCWFLSDGEFDYPGNLLLPEEAAPPPVLPVPYTSLLVDTGPVRIAGPGPKFKSLRFQMSVDTEEFGIVCVF